MNEYEYGLTKEKIYYKRLDNGLKIYFIPNDKQNHYYINVACLYGSSDIEFIPIDEDKMFKSPIGAAHFLEHKLFAMKDGSDPFSFFASSGAMVNAATSYYSTRYYVWGINAFEANLKYLLDMVFTPHFTKNNVLKEQGIIQEEIKMYDDDPSWSLDYALRNSLFINSYIKEKIGGTIESIGKLDENTLYKIYNTFYQPNNMIILIGGKFDYKKTLDFIVNNTVVKSLPKGKEIIRKKITEPDSVKEEYIKVTGNVILPKLKYAFKINKDKLHVKEPIIANMYLNCIFAMLFGDTSDFYEKVYAEKLTTSYYYEHSYHDNFYIFEIEAESDKADLFKDLVDSTLNNIQLSEDELNLHKKVWTSSEVRLSDHNDFLSDGVLEDVITYDKIYYNRDDIINGLNIRDLEQIISELDLSNNTFALLLPDENQNY